MQLPTAHLLALHTQDLGFRLPMDQQPENHGGGEPFTPHLLCQLVVELPVS